MQTPFQLYDSFKISIVQDRIDRVSKNLKVFLKDFALKQEVLGKVDFRKVCSTRTIPNSNKIKFILYEPAANPGSTIFFANFEDGWFTAVRNYSRIYKRNAFQVGFTTNELKDYPSFFFYYFYFNKGNFTQRTVHAIKESNWVFYSDGSSLAIEDINNYRKRSIKDRINNEIIIGYLKNAGYHLTDKSFYTSNKKAILFTN